MLISFSLNLLSLEFLNVKLNHNYYHLLLLSTLLRYNPTFLGYAARAFSSIDVENAHSILNHLLKTGAQTCTIEEMTWLISTLMRMQILSKTEIGREIELRDLIISMDIFMKE